MLEPYRARTFDRAEAKLDLIGELGCDLLMVCSNVSPLALGGISRAAADFAELGERAAKRGMRVAFEALGWGRHVNDYRDSWEIVCCADHPAVGLTLDTFHIFSRGTDLGAIPQIPGDRIFLVQVADAPNLSMDHLSWSRHYRCFPGQGELPVRKFMDGLAATGYDGPLSLEIFNDQFRTGSVKSTALDGYRSLVYLGSRAEDAKASELPAASAPQNIEFIEFAPDDTEAVDLARVLDAIGFVHVGSHPTKAVDLYVQGTIKLVFNCEPGSDAARYHALHGPSVCAVGLGEADAAKGARRADLLEYATQQSGTHGMRAIRVSGGSLLYLADSAAMPGNWDREFTVHAAPDKALLRRVDHAD